MKTKSNTILIGVAIIAYWIGLCNASAFYDPGTQRWLNRDPIQENGGINSYQSEKNAALNFVDPYGLQCDLIFEPPPVIPRALIDQAIEANRGAARVPLPDGRKLDLFDKFGRGHFDKATQQRVPTPHVHEPAPPEYAPRFPEWTRPATPQDIQDAINHLQGGNGGIGGCGNCNQNNPAFTYPNGMQPSTDKSESPPPQYYHPFHCDMI